VDVMRELVWYVSAKLYYFFDGTYTLAVAEAALDFLGQLWYFYIGGIILAVLISLLWPRERIALFFQRSSGVSIIAAALAGVVSPMPTYVAIPLVAALYKVGVPSPPLFAFLVSSPLMNPVLFSLTAGAFGSEMAMARLMSACSLGILSGFLAQFLNNRNHLKKFICSDGLLAATLPVSQGAGRRLGFYSRAFAIQLSRLTLWSSKYFLLGIFIAAAVKVLIPASWIISTLGYNRGVSVLAAVAAGVPLYACGGGSIPVMQTLQDLGMDKGAILAFFISGPATKLSTLVALKAAIVKESFLLYLGIAFLGATAFGVTYGMW